MRKSGTFVLFILIALAFFITSCEETQKITKNYSDAVISAPDRAKIAKLRSYLRNIKAGANLYRGKYGHYPEDVQDIVDTGCLTHIPKDPFGGQYVIDVEHKIVYSTSFPKVQTHLD